jgi:hypothetical protein
MADELTLEHVRAMAADAGMRRLTDEHLEQLFRATKAARARRAVLRSDTLTPADEPSHVFRLGAEVVR